jgi:hypothetical protein
VIYPSLLRPTSQESFALPSGTLAIPKAELTLRRWTGEPVANTFGSKPLIDFAGRPLFAELCVYELLRLSGWEARWVETYGAPAMRPYYFTTWADAGLASQRHDPITTTVIVDRLQQQAVANQNSFAGCWDLVAWQGERVLFVELKRLRQDRVRSSQHRWLEAGLRIGLQAESFLLVEWDFTI